MEIPSKYNPANSEDKWYSYWLKNGFFHSEPDNRESYTIVIPPPNVTGVLHMGHMLNNTIQDVLVRRARMKGLNACWVPGTDHASIATEAKVVQKLKSEGKSKTDMTREEFLGHAWDWTEKHGGIILEQLKKLGASCDWERTKFTMDKDLSQSVIETFVDLHNKGLVYRGVRMVNWDPSAQTALSDEEVIHKDEHSKLYYLKYIVEDTKEVIFVATTRPETILGDSALCVNPNDPRYTHLKGKRVIVPIVGRSIPIIHDDYVDIEFGTGALKVTPAHDINDYMLGQKYNLEVIDIFNDNGTINDKVGMYVGVDRFDLRKQIAIDLQEAGLMEKIEDYDNKVGISERTGVAIEPKLSMQWFLKMEELSKPALEAVMNDDVALYPSKFKNTYKHWMENIKDWCVSRQLWWGQQIPAYYLPNGGFVVATTPEEALVLAKEKTGNDSLTIDDLRQDEDVLDTWFSSWLWPISVFDGISNPNNKEIEYYYPTNDLVTGPDILFFWVARMIVAGYEYRGEKPFSNVYLTGIVRDAQHRKMSKSLGNSPDPLDLIAKYGADSIRVAMLLCASAGNDILWDETLPEQGRNFSNKIWNAFRLVKNWEVSETIEQPLSSKISIDWFDSLLSKSIKEMSADLDNYRISESLMQLYRLFWDEFSGWYLEMIKPSYQKPIDKATYDATVEFFEKLLKLLHPFMPFITEEIWHFLGERKEGESIMIELLPEVTEIKEPLLTEIEQSKEIITAIRNIRKSKNIANKDSVELKIKGGKLTAESESVILKIANVSSVEVVTKDVAGASSFIVKGIEFYVPLGDNLNVEEELLKMKTELEYTQGFLKSVLKKLSNERFVNSAPAKVVEIERTKQADAEEKINILNDQITKLSNI
ncbi:MAG: valine--tRNA ligase [Bacteroidetes bacterium]|nr:valine--tRNA ligase [Bacteroidota bacterium]